MKDIAIRENHLYSKVFRNGEHASGKHIVVYILRDWGAKREMLRNPEKKYINRVGLSVSKKVGGAVERNRVKRIIRAGLAEARKHGELKTGYLIVIAGRVGAHESDSATVAQELVSAFTKLKMYRQPTENSENSAKAEELAK